MNKINLTLSEIIYIRCKTKDISFCEHLDYASYTLTDLNHITKIVLTYGFKKELIRIAYTMPITNFTLPLFYKIINTVSDIFNRKFCIQSTE